MEETKKQERQVIHLYLKKENLHQYFGSTANIYEFYSVDDIGITYGALRNYFHKNQDEKMYENSKVIIRKGILMAKPKKK